MRLIKIDSYSNSVLWEKLNMGQDGIRIAKQKKMSQSNKYAKRTKKCLSLSFLFISIFLSWGNNAKCQITQPLFVDYSFVGYPSQTSYTFMGSGPFSTTKLSTHFCATSTFTWTVFPSTGVIISNPSIEDPTITFTNPGSYSVKLNVTTYTAPGFLCATDSKDRTKTVIIVKPPIPKFKTNGVEAATVTAILNNEVALTDFSDNQPTSWGWTITPSTGWSFTSGNAASKNISVKFNTVGAYDVTFKATNAAGSNTIQKPKHINVVAVAPVSNFTASATSIVQNATVSFTDASTNLPTSWAWAITPASGYSYVSGNSSSQNPVVNFSSPGVYNVALTATNSGGSNTITKSNYITVSPPPPNATTLVTYCQGAPASPLSANGNGSLRWYTTSSGGTAATNAPTPSTSSGGTLFYYVSQVVNGVESPRTQINVIITATPSAPLVITPIRYCPGATASALTAGGTNLKWYNTSSGGSSATSAPVPSTAVAGTTNYFVSQSTNNGCEGPRAQITVIVNATLAVPTVNTPINYCLNAMAAPLNATGVGITWYNVAAGGTGTTVAPLPATNMSGTTSFFVSQTSPGCTESQRAKMDVIVGTTPVPAAPSVNTPVYYLIDDPASPLIATGSGLKWYTAATGGTGSEITPTPSTATAGTSTYYVAQHINGCQGPRAKIDVKVSNPKPPFEWEWVKQKNLNKVNELPGNKIAADAAGNVFVLKDTGTGVYFAKYDTKGSLLWKKNISGSVVALDSKGNSYVGLSGPNLVINKLDKNGNLLWTKSFINSNGAYIYGIAVDLSENIYITGNFTGTATFGNISLTAAGGGYDIFIAKYAAAGTAVWAKSTGGISNDFGHSIAVDGNGNSYMTGTTSGSLIIAKYAPSGVLGWTKLIGTTNNTANGNSIVSDVSGNIFVTGSFNGTVNFGITNLTSNGGQDIFVVKYNASGQEIWCRKMGGPAVGIKEGGNGVALDIDGNVIVTGNFSDIIIFGKSVITSNNSSDFFIAQFDPSGNPAWAKSAGFSLEDGGSSVSVDGLGNIYCTGYFHGQYVSEVSFGSFKYLTSDLKGFFGKLRPGYSPVIEDFTPSIGLKGSSVKISGVNFNGITTVKFNGVSSSNIIVESDYEITAGVPFNATSGPITVESLNGIDTTIENFTVKSPVNISSPEWVWATKVGSGSGDGTGSPRTSATDGSGFTYHTGNFSQSILLDTIVLSASFGSGYIVKYNKNGRAEWAKNVANNVSGGAYNSFRIRGIAIDISGNSYITGEFAGSYKFGSGTITSVASAPSTNIFIAKFDASGNNVWVVRDAVDLGSRIYSIATDGSKNIYITGTTATRLINSTFKNEMYVAKFSTQGSKISGRTITFTSGTYFEAGNDISADASGNVYSTGRLNLSGSNTGYFEKRNSNGGSWEKILGPSVSGNAISFDEVGNVYLTGSFGGSATFGGTTVNSNGSSDVFIVKYNADGNVVWAKSAGSSVHDNASAIATDPEGNSYITGSFNGSIIFGSKTLTSNGNSDIFVVKYDASGEVVWAEQTGGTGFDEGRGITIDGSGNCYVNGGYSQSIVFGNTTLTGNGGFIAKFGWVDRTIVTRPLAKTSFTQGENVSVPYITTGKFGVGNIFKVQLSDAGGSFKTPVEIGSGSGNPLAIVIPSSTAPCSGYRIRVISSNPEEVGSDNGTNLVINPQQKPVAPEGLMVKRTGVDIDEYNTGSKISTDPSGNSYVLGSFKNFVAFDTIQMNTADEGIYIVKYNNDQKVVWAKQVAKSGVLSKSRGTGINLDRDGNLYVTGTFNNSILFGTQQLNSAGFSDVFIAKFTSTGELLYIQRVGNEWDDSPGKIFVDNSGNCYLTGWYIGVNNKSFARVAKISASGQLLWMDEFDYFGGVIALTITADLWNHCYVTIASTREPFLGKYSSSIFLRKYSASGVPIWTKDAAQYATVVDMGIDNLGNSYITGNFVGSTIIGEKNFESVNYSSDIYIAKFDTSGSVMWAKASGGVGDEESHGLAIDACGNAYITGSFYNNAVFEDITLINNSSNSDALIVKYDGAGNALWGKRFGGNQQDRSSGISLDALGNSYLTGFLDNPMNASQSIEKRYIIKIGTPGSNDCSMSGKAANIWQGEVNAAWETGLNWSCSGKAPDANTDVIINSGNVILNSNTTIKSLTIKDGATLTVRPGYKITISGK